MFFKKLSELCEKNSISLHKLVTDLNMSSSNITNWQNGVIPQRKTVKKIADYFNVPVEYFSTVKAINNVSVNNGHLTQASTIITYNGEKHERELSEMESLLLKVFTELETGEKAELLSYAFKLKKNKPAE